MQRYAQQGDYMPIGDAPCLNLVTAVIDYYKRSPKRLKTIFLDHTHWRLFVEDLKKLQDSNPDYEINATVGIAIEHCDVTVKRGSQFQEREMKYEFYKDVELRPELANEDNKQLLN